MRLSWDEEEVETYKFKCNFDLFHWLNVVGCLRRRRRGFLLVVFKNKNLIDFNCGVILELFFKELVSRIGKRLM